MMKKKGWFVFLGVTIFFLTAGNVAAAGNTDSTIVSPKAQMAATAPLRLSAEVPQEMRKVRFIWDPVPDAVSYQLVILKEAEASPANIVLTRDKIFTNGYEFDTSMIGKEKYGYYWSVCGIDHDGKAVGGFSKPQPVVSDGAINTDAPMPTTEFDKMAYAPLYPVYSWIPYAGAFSYEVQVWKKARAGGSSRLIRDINGEGSNIYDDAGYTDPGVYWWQVRALNGVGSPLSKWSETREFSVVSPVKVAALGDSVTHGGGAISTPPGYLMYDWESYSAVPIKNMGFSGNTVEDMLSRFDTDVLAFSPKILVIMGGVNNFRAGDSAAHIIHVLAQIRDKCREHAIMPVFVTATPINPDYMDKAYGVDPPVDGWLRQQQRLNAWIVKQIYAVDVTPGITDENGWLRDGWTSDGLHPDMEGKKYIGETISSYLLKHFPELRVSGNK
jgi:lysophospholipase L1-like esterase